jgi:glycosyltransferase involved in cell wall biosynthesis
MKKYRIFYPYKFNKNTWAIVVVMCNIAYRLKCFIPLCRRRDPEIGQGKVLGLGSQLLGKYDLVHIHSPTPYSLVTFMIAWLQRKPRIFTGAYPPAKEDSYFRRYYWCAKLATRVYGISQRVADKTELNCKVKVSGVIPNGVDYEFFSREKCQLPVEIESNNIQDYFVIVGTLCKRKNSMFVLELAKQLPDQNFVFVGSISDDAPDFEREAESLDNVYHVGFRGREEVRDFIGHSKAMLFPTNEEGFGLVAAEAMAMGKPVVAQPIDVMQEVLGGFSDCKLISAEDTEGWKKCLSEINDQNHEAIRVQVIETYCWQKIADQYEVIYAEVLEK